mgnify:FL=1
MWVQVSAEPLTSIPPLKITSRGRCRDLGTREIEIKEDSELFVFVVFLKPLLSQGDLIHFSAKSEERKQLFSNQV